MKILFVYHHSFPRFWQDGLWAAMQEMSGIHDVSWLNLDSDYNTFDASKYNWVIGWGAFGSPADNYCKEITGVKKALLLGGNASPIPAHAEDYNIIFYETDWIKKNYISSVKTRLVKAFGINTNIFEKLELDKIWDYLSVGAFAYWKHHEMLADKFGNKICIGEIQRDNMRESMDIITQLLKNNVAVSGMIEPEMLAKFYNMSNTVYVPADVNGGGERTVLEARACGCKIEIENNEKLQELIDGPIYTHIDYFNSLNTALCEP